MSTPHTQHAPQKKSILWVLFLIGIFIGSVGFTVIAISYTKESPESTEKEVTIRVNRRLGTLESYNTDGSFMFSFADPLPRKEEEKQLMRVYITEDTEFLKITAFEKENVVYSGKVETFNTFRIPVGETIEVTAVSEKEKIRAAQIKFGDDVLF